MDETAHSNEPEPEMSIAEMLAQTANEVIHSAVPEGFEWVEEYSMYYSRDSGYFYDQNSCMYYHSETQTYLYFDDSTQSYQVYANMQKKNWSRKSHRKRATDLFGEDYVQHKMDQDLVDCCESIFDLVRDVARREIEREERGSDRRSSKSDKHRKSERKRSKKREKEIEIMKKRFMRDEEPQIFDGEDFVQDYPSSSEYTERIESRKCSESDSAPDSEDERVQMMQEEGFSEAPLLRIIDHRCSLHIITMAGGTIGSGNNCDIQFPELNKIHFRIELNSEDKDYKLLLLCESIGVSVNGVAIELEKEESLFHGSYITIGDEICLLVHVHYGYNMCPGCDPSSLQPAKEEQNVVPTLRGEAARRQAMRALKGSYGINDYESERTSGHPDRAKHRRNTVGSVRDDKDLEAKKKKKGEGIYANCDAQPMPGAVVPSRPSAQQALDSENKGFKLLQSMGWKAGEGLGKEKSGRVEPVATTLKSDRTGLGADKKQQPQSKRERDSAKMKERFEKIRE